MNIIERNFFRLLRAGAFGQEEPLEPLSAWKWNRLYQLSEMHDVADITYRGLTLCSNQFFAQPPEALKLQWAGTVHHDDDDTNDLLAPDRLTNPVLNRRLQAILDSEGSNTETRSALLHLTGIARFVMNAGIPVKRVVALGVFLRQNSSAVDFNQLQEWVRQLQLAHMTQLAGVMLIKLLGFQADELPFIGMTTDERMEREVSNIIRQKNSHTEEWYFSQGKNIFVHTSNATAMLWHVRRSAHYFSYYPMETLTNFFASFTHSLSHIEE